MRTNLVTSGTSLTKAGQIDIVADENSFTDKGLRLISPCRSRLNENPATRYLTHPANYCDPPACERSDAQPAPRAVPDR